MDISFRCMVYGNPFYISIVAPVAIIILKNIIILTMVLSRLHKRRIRCKPMAHVITEARRAFVCNILLGTTWVLAFFAVEDAAMIFQWLFCVGFLSFFSKLYKIKMWEIRGWKLLGRIYHSNHHSKRKPTMRKEIKRQD